MRSTLRSLLVSVLVASGVAALPGATASASEAAGAQAGVGSPLGGPLVAPSVDQLLRGEGARAARQARRANPVAVAGRSAARVRFEGVAPARAASLAEAAFPSLAAPAAGMSVLAHGERVLRYETNHAAEVSLANGDKGLIESIAPIATTVGHRHMPLDLRLTAARGGFAPVRSSVDVQVPKQLEDGGVSLPGISVSLTPVDVHGAPLAGSQGQLRRASVLWRHADRQGALDLASVVKATAGGLDLSTMLLSRRSPGKLYFHLGLPSGAHLAHTGTGAVQVLRGAALLARVAPVSAEDAEGTSVPAKMSVRGNTLAVSVDAAGDYLYPIAVDPEIETNDSQLAETAGEERSNWEFHTSSSAHFEKHWEKGVERLETKGIGNYTPGEIAYWGYQTQGVSHIYEIKVIDSAHNLNHKVESFLEFVGPGGTKETERKLSSQFSNPEYENKEELAFCADNPLKEEELDPPACGPTFGKANNIFHFEQAATGNPEGNYGFSDSMTQGIISIAEPSGTHSTTSYNTSSSTIEVEVEGPGGKEKVKRTNALLSGANTWLSRLPGKEGGAIGLKAADTGIGVSGTKLEYESASKVWTPLEEHNYRTEKHLSESGCRGVQCFVTHEEGWTLTPTLPDGEQTVRYKAHEAISGTETVAGEGTATVKVDTKKPHGLFIAGLPFDGELSERPYELTVRASDGEGSTIASSGIKKIELFVDGKEFGAAGGSCTAAKGECTATNKWTVNGAELGAGKHGLVVVAFDNAGNEGRYEQKVAIRHSTPVAMGPGSVDLQSGDFALGANDVSMGSGLTVGRNYSSRATTAGGNGPFGPEWNFSLGNSESLAELPDGDVVLSAANGGQTIFAALGEGKFESPPGDSNIELTLEENKETKQKLAYYLKNPAASTSVKFKQPVSGGVWVPVTQEGAVATDTVTYSYNTVSAVSQYPVPGAGEGSDLEGITGGPDGNAWFVDHTGNKVGKISPTGGVTTYSLPSESLPNRIIAGPDGNLWFTESKKIGKVTPSGKITEYKTPYPEYGGQGIAIGSDGYIWYSDPINNNINKMEVASGFTWTAVHLPTGSSPTELTLGPDGNIWFVDGSFSTRHKIGKITTAGVVTEYSLPEGSKPVDITAGSGSSLWFTNSATKKVGKITTTGEVSEYSLPESGTPNHIAKGPDGNVWFTAQKNVGKVTPSGEVSEYWVGAPSSVDIASGSDGKLWFTGAWSFESGTYHVGSIVPPGTIAEPKEVRAPVPSGVSCSWTSEPTEMEPGCRALEFHYYSWTWAKGDAKSEWGGFVGQVEKVLLVAYDPASKMMKETAVAQYEYDALGRLRAEWDPRISPSLKTTYGYDAEGHVTAISPPGQEPWALTYGPISGDKGTGRLLKAKRVPASTELWKGEAVANTEAPKIGGSATESVMLSASAGKWSGAPVSYAYQWNRCASGACTAIPGATNPNYTVQAADAGDTLSVTVRATNADGSVAANSVETSTVKTLASSLTEYSVPAGSLPLGMTAGPEAGTLWFTDLGSSKIGKVTSSGTITEYALPTGSEPEGIVKGPDGNLWFVDSGTSKVGKITTSGTITEYALPAGSRPRSIAVGADGNLWFTEYSKAKIGKITTSGTITEYALSGTLPQPFGITAGPDGNLWFGERTKICKITTGGAVTEYPISGGGRAITTGPDGNLWFTGRGATSFGKITTSGAISTYTVSSFVEPPEAITSVGGALWLTSKYTNQLYRVSTSADVSEYALPTGSQPQQLAANSLGEIWFAEANNKIVKISSSVAGEARSPEPGSTLEYNVPLSGAKAPHNMSEGEVARWGQVDDPAEATAIFPSDESQAWPASGYKRATIYYLDEHGRQVNVASPSAEPNGAIATSEHNEFNDVIRTLTPDNRLTALAAGAGSAEKSKLLDTQNTYNGEGKKESEVEEAGTRLIDVLGPQHTIKYRAGGEQKESLARHHEVLVYNQGAPGGEKYDLVTERYDLAQLANHEEVEVRTTKTSYSGQSNLGWKLRSPTSATVDPEGLKQTTTTEYNSTTGQITEVRGAGADTTLSYASKFGEGGTEPGKLKNPWGVAVNSEGKLLVVDTANNRIEKFGPEGAYISSFGEAGSGNGQLKEPEGIALDSAGHISGRRHGQ